MKNTLKKTNLLVVTLLCVFAFLGTANAACTPSSRNNSCREVASGTIEAGKDKSNATKMTKSSTTKKYSDYGVQYRINEELYGSESGTFYRHTGSYNSTTKILHCLDANATGINENYASRFLLDSRYGAGVRAYDTAILSILYATKDVASDSDDYLAANIAIRAITATWKFGLTGDNHSSSANNVFKAHQGLAYRWVTQDATAKAAFEKLSDKGYTNSLANLKTSEKYDFVPYWGGTWESAGNATLEKAKSLYVSAIQEASNAVDLGVSEVAISNATIVAGSTNTYTYTLHLKNFANGSKFKIKSSNRYTVISATLNGATLQTNGAENIISNPSNVADLEVKLTVRIDSTVTCGVRLEYAYAGTGSDNYKGYTGVVWYATKVSTDNRDEYQRFVSIEKVKNSDGDGDFTDGNLPLTQDCNCTMLKNDCKTEYSRTRNMNGSACRTLIDAGCACEELELRCELGIRTSDGRDACEQKTLVCNATCDTTYDEFECCEYNETTGDRRVKVSKDDDINVGIQGPSEVKACFVDKVETQKLTDGTKEYDKIGYVGAAGIRDQKNNTYTLKNDNKYCVVSCKEDYAMVMPTAKITNSGRYFTFKAKVNGTKTCYTNKIDIEQYNKDVEALVKDMQDEFQLFNKYRTADIAFSGGNNTYGIASGIISKYDSASGCECSVSKNALTGLSTNISYNYYLFTVSKVNGINTVSRVTSTSSSYNYEDDSLSDGGSDGYCSGCCVCCSPGAIGCSSKTGVGASGTSGTYTESMQTFIRNARDTHWNKYDELRGTLERLLAQYKDCSNSSWTSEINYDANVYYDYEETYMSKINKYGDMEKQIANRSTDVARYWNMNSTINSDYSNYNSSYLPTTSSNVYYITCNKTTGICNNTEWNAGRLSTAQYVSKESTINVNYKPATLFYNTYPIGEIVNESEARRRDDAVALERNNQGLLPVSLNTKRGIYEYTVNVENLGEFYQSKTLGRYVGSSTAIVDNKTLTYACNYIVNMGEVTSNDIICDFSQCSGGNCISMCIGPNCDGECNGVNCIAKCIGLGCIYDEGGAGSSLIERTVSLNKMFPNGVDSYNWKNVKGQTTVTEIEQSGGSYYINGNDTSGNKIYDSTPILSLTIDPSTARDIKKYNKSVEEEGGYSNNTISCEAKEGYQEIACYSSFIDDLLNGKYGNNVVNNNSYIYGTADRSGNRSVNNYFKLWTGTKSEDLMMGPSWK